jgi:hypothetical protein
MNIRYYIAVITQFKETYTRSIYTYIERVDITSNISKRRCRTAKRNIHNRRGKVWE